VRLALACQGGGGKGPAGRGGRASFLPDRPLCKQITSRGGRPSALSPSSEQRCAGRGGQRVGPGLACLGPAPTSTDLCKLLCILVTLQAVSSHRLCKGQWSGNTGLLCQTGPCRFTESRPGLGPGECRPEDGCASPCEEAGGLFQLALGTSFSARLESVAEATQSRPLHTTTPPPPPGLQDLPRVHAALHP
jgi:hypothetical protein